VMAAALVEMRGTTSPRLVLELACARVLLPGATSDSSALLARLDRLEARLSATVSGDPVATVTDVVPPPAAAAPSEPGPEPVATVKPAPAEEPAESDPAAAVDGPEAAESGPASAADGPAAGAFDVAALKRLWDAVLEAVKLRSRTANALMLSSQIESLDDRTLTLSFPTPTLATRFANDVSDFVAEALKEVVGMDLVLRAVSPAGAPPPSDPPASGRAAQPGSPSPVAPTGGTTDPEPDEIDATDEAASGLADVTDSALALLKKEVGAQVIGEIDRT
jgi:DNA polymerase III subunit gamma/tau